MNFVPSIGSELQNACLILFIYIYIILLRCPSRLLFLSFNSSCLTYPKITCKLNEAFLDNEDLDLQNVERKNCQKNSRLHFYFLNMDLAFSKMPIMKDNPEALKNEKHLPFCSALLAYKQVVLYAL